MYQATVNTKSNADITVLVVVRGGKQSDTIVKISIKLQNVGNFH